MMDRSGSVAVMMAAVATLLAGVASPTAAQVTVGARLGTNLADLRSVEDVETNRESATLGGVWANFGGTVSVQPELLFSKRKASFTEGGLTLPFTQNFIEIPALLMYRLGTGVVQPSVYGGASVSFETDCDTDFSALPAGPGGCSDFFGADTESRLWAGIVGAALHLQVGPVIVGLDARYNHGFTALAPDSDVKWSYYSVGVEAGIGLGR